MRPSPTADEHILVNLLLTEEHVTMALLDRPAPQPPCACGQQDHRSVTTSLPIRREPPLAALAS